VCLIVFALRAHPAYRLVVAANRDEFHARPTAPATYWEDAPNVLAGRDLTAGGTWLGVTKDGRFAAVTNVRDPSAKVGSISRGALVREFLVGSLDAHAAAREAVARAHDVSPFNLVVGSIDGLSITDGSTVTTVDAGVRGITNASETERSHGGRAWPKLGRAERLLAATVARGEEIEVEPLFELLSDRAIAPDDELPSTGVGLESERFLSSTFLVSPLYGTRSSTVVLFHANGRVDFEERSFEASGAPKGIVRVSFAVQS
jgi:uncharacterized protein with NRDE domain